MVIATGSRRALAKLAFALLATATFWAPWSPCAASELRRSAIVKAVEQVRPAVVNIRGEKVVTATDERAPGVEVDRRVNGMGTGIIIDDRGYILTNHHVVDGVSRIEVTMFDGAQRIAKLVTSDERTDLAIIKIDADEKLPIITVGTSSDLMHGETVIAVGNAYGYEHTVTRGIISALHRSVEVGEGVNYDDLIQTDASINPGNSGGPLLNIDGEMIGVNVAVRAGAQGIGFAIPVDKAMQVAAELLSTRRVVRTWHGVVPKPNLQGKDPGLVVAGFEEASPAAAAELQVGDVIREVNGRRVDRTLDFERMLLDQKAGDAVELSVDRGGRSVHVTLTLATVPREATPAPQGQGDEIWQELGLKLKPIAPAAFRELHTTYRGGMSVVAVRPNSPAAKQGIHRGDVLVGIHVYETISDDNVLYVLHSDDLAKIQPLKFYILRDGQTLFGYMSLDRGQTGVARLNR
ncbi:MAG: trypsin-like peptidase domain-containing protein [Pirellulales bacterium]|nr:trypsin-like peptidase domain-containing protein [Pirellulales bacterium]